MTHLSNWVAQLRKSLSTGRQQSGFQAPGNRSAEDWEPVRHQEQAVRLLVQAGNELDSSIFFFDFSGVRGEIQRGEGGQIRSRYATLGRIFESGADANTVILRYDDLSFFVFFGGAGRQRGAEKCRDIWNRVVKELDLTPAASKGLKLYEVEVPEPVPAQQSDLFDSPSLRFQRLIPDFPLSDAEQGPEEIGGPIGFIYRPLMEVATNMISMFVCIPTKRVSKRNFRYGYGVLDDADNVRAIRQLDLRVLGAVASTLRQMGKKSHGSLVMIPVHFGTLSHPMSRISYALTCSQRLAEFSDSVVFEIIGIPERAPTERLVNAVAPLMMHSHSVCARVPLDREDLHNYQYSGIAAVGVDAYPLDQDREQLAFQLSDFVERANAQSLKTYVHGIRSLSLSTFVSCSGFDCVGGHALTNAIKAPRSAYLYKLLFKYIAMA